MDSFIGPLAFTEALVGALAVRLGPLLNERLGLCEALDCVERDLSLAWPGIEKGRD